MSGQSQEAGLLSTVLSELQTALQLDPQNKLADQLLEEISYSIPGAVRRGESGYVLLGLTQTVLPPTAYILETPTETPAQPAPATSTPSPEPSPTAPVITQPSPTSLPPGRVPNPLCGAGALPALGGILWAARRRKDPKRN
jgi:hypothetical protein